jgi:trehalose 6-phosphate synthase
MHLVAVPLSARDMDRYYDGFSNATLWPLYHDAIATPEFNSQWWEAYVEVNDRFGAVAAACAADKATVWVHDYQLQLVPSCLRRRRPDVRIGLFNHVPFPGYEIFAQLPWRRRLVQGMLGADLIGFQRQADATNFLRACGRLALNPEGAAVDMPPAPNPDNTRDAPEVGDRRRVRVGVFPISIDFARFDDLARRDDVRARAQEIRSQLGDPQILLLGVDRLDYTKGILHRLRAYEQLLADGLMGPPGSVMVQIATPTRERVEQYKALLREVEAMVGRINGDHATMSQPAVRYLHHAYPHEEIAALYLAADVMLVTSLRDGMNLVAMNTCHSGTTSEARSSSASSPAPRNSWAAHIWSTRMTSKD